MDEGTKRFTYSLPFHRGKGKNPMPNTITTTIEEIITPTEAAIAAMEANESLLRSRDNRPTVKITVNQFVDIVTNHISGQGIVTAYVETMMGHTPECGTKLLKKHKISKLPTAEVVDLPVRKCTAVNFNAWADYARLVELQREREGTEGEFVLGKVWHERFEGRKGNFFVHHKDDESRIYLSAPAPKTIGGSVYIDGSGQEMTKDGVSDMYSNLMSPRKGSTRQGVKNTIKFKVFKLEGIRYFVMRGVIYHIMH